MVAMKGPLFAVALLAAGLPATARAHDLHVVASFTVLADMVREIGGADVGVTSLVGPEGDPHVFEPTPQDADALAKADLVVVSGLGLEGWMDRLITASGYKGSVVTASKGIAQREMEEDGHEETDPHAWNSAANGALYARNITAALVAADPEDKAAIEQRGQAYAAKLEELDRWAKAEVAAIPAEKRKVITSHDAFGYMGARYGITFLAPEGLSTDAEASASDVARLIDQARKDRIKAIFLENSNDPRLVTQIAAETGVKPDQELYPESLTGKNGPAATYEAMFRYNIETLVNGMKRN